MASRCRKFEPNIFNKLKCQNCFKPKEQHSAEALENSKAARKISKCGYLFVAPETFDFHSPLDKTRRWQRRFFVLYDDGELTYSVDENASTVPQGVLDMNKCTDVYDAETKTTHNFSIAVKADNKTTFIKGTNKEEIGRWHDVLVMYPRSIKTKHRRSPTYISYRTQEPQTQQEPVSQPAEMAAKGTTDETRTYSAFSIAGTPNKRARHQIYDGNAQEQENMDPNSSNDVEMTETNRVGHIGNQPMDIDSTASSQNTSEAMSERKSIPTEPTPLKFRGVRSMKHKNDKAYQEVLRKSSSLNDLSTNEHEEFDGAQSRRSRSRESQFGTFPRRRAVSSSPCRSQSSLSNTTDSDHSGYLSDGQEKKPKTFFESLLNPQPPKPQTKNSRYLRLANIPQTKSIENYVGQQQNDSAQRVRRRTLPAAWVTGSNTSANSTPTQPSSRDNVGSIFGEVESMSASLRTRFEKPVSANKDSEKKCEAQSAGPSALTIDRGAARMVEAHQQSSGSAKRDSIEQGSTDTSNKPVPAVLRRLSAPSAPSRSRSATPPRSRSPGSYLHTHSPENPNETDEYKMAKSADLSARLSGPGMPEPSSRPSSRTSRQEDGSEEQMYMKKGWLVKQGDTDKDWIKHWFVLSGTALTFYQDARAEEASKPDGRFDLSACLEVTEMNIARNYGFKIKTQEGDHVLSAMTSGIRNNWVQAIQKCLQNNNQHSTPSLALSSETGSVSSPRSSMSDSTTSLSSIATMDSGKLTGSLSSASWRSNQFTEEWKSAPSSPGSTKIRSRPARDIGATINSALADEFPLARTPPVVVGNVSSPNPVVTPQTSSQTWRYASSKNSRKSETPSRSGSDTTEKSREFSAEEQEELDEVERNIRKIHRKSLTEYVQQHKPRHFDKFESGSAFTEKDRQRSGQDKDRLASNVNKSVAAFEDRHASSRKQSQESAYKWDREYRTASPSQKQAEKETDRFHRTRSPSLPRAPSAKVKEKKRSKSPRARSPPPERDESEGYFDQLAKKGSLRISSESAADSEGSEEREERGSDDIIERKWREVEGVGLSTPVKSKRAERTKPPAASTLRAGDVALVELLEAEVESLKAQLERSQKELTEVHRAKIDLSAQLKATHRENRDSLDDMQSDQSRFLSQIEDIQNEMEMATEYYVSKLAAQESEAELNQLQVQTLRRQLKDSKDTVDDQQIEIDNLKSKLSMSISELSETETALAKAVKEVKREKEHFQKMSEEWEVRIIELEKQVKDYDRKLKDKESEVRAKEEEIRCKMNELQTFKHHINDKEERLSIMEEELAELRELQHVVEEKEERIRDMSEELSHTQVQLQERNLELESMEVDHLKKVNDMETDFHLEKDKLEQKVQQLDIKLKQIQKQSNMADSLNSNMADILHEKDETIAQLEEKVIENDNKIAELTDELNYEMDESATIQTNLEKFHTDNEQLKEHIERLQKEVEQLKSQLQKSEAEVAQLKAQCCEMQCEYENMQVGVSNGEQQVVDLKRDNSGLTDALEAAREQCQTWQSDVKGKQQEIDALQRLLEQEKAARESLENRYREAVTEITGLKAEIKSYEQRLISQQEKLEADLKKKYEELSKTKGILDDLQKKLEETEETMHENSAQLDESSASLKQNQKLPSFGNSKQSSSDEEYSELKDKYEKTAVEVKRLRRQIKESHSNCDEMELNHASLTKQFEKMEEDYQGQLTMMGKRVEDLTTKLIDAEKKVQKLERRDMRQKTYRQKKEMEQSQVVSKVEASLRELEGKVSQAEAMLKGQDVEAMELEASLASLEQTAAAYQAAQKDRDSIGEDTSDSDGDKQPTTNSELKTRLELVHKQIIMSDERIQELSKKLQDQLHLQDELLNMHGIELQLREESEKQKAKITTLSYHLKESKSKEVSNEVLEQLQLTEHKLNNTSDMLISCRNKLADVIQDLGTFGITPSKDNYISTIDHIDKRLRDILKESEIDSSHIELPESRKIDPGAVVSEVHVPSKFYMSTNEKLRLFAKRLSLEAVLVGEMAYLVEDGPERWPSLTESLLQEIKQANCQIFKLEDLIETLGEQNNSNRPKTEGRDEQSLKVFTSLLAEKMVLQGQLDALMKENSRTSNSLESMPKSDFVGQAIAKEAFMRSHRTLSPVDEGDSVSTISAISSQAMLEGQLSCMLHRLKDRMETSGTDQSRFDILEHERQMAHRRLLVRQQSVNDIVSEFKNQKVHELASIMVEEALSPSKRSVNEDTKKHELNNGVATVEPSDPELIPHMKEIQWQECHLMATQIVSKELVHAEMTHAVSQYIHHFMQKITQENVGTELDRTVVKQSKFMESALKEEVDSTMQQLMSEYDIQLQEVQTGPSEDKTSEDLATRKIIVISKLAQVLAQRIVIIGQVKHVSDLVQNQKQIKTHDTSTSDLVKQSDDLCRNDSGILCANSLPTSPTSPADSDLSLRGSRALTELIWGSMIQNAQNKEDLAQRLKEMYEYEGTKDGVQAQIYELAADLAKVDFELLKHRRRFNEYTDMVAKEAMYQAQLVYATSRLEMQHEEELQTLRNEFTDARTTTESHVVELESEIEQLSVLLTEKGSLSMDSDSSEVENIMQTQTMSKSSDFQQKDIEILQRQLSDAKQELLRLHAEKDAEVAEYKRKMSELEDEIDELRSSEEAHNRQVEGQQHRIAELEEQLTDLKEKYQAEVSKAADGQSDVADMQLQISDLEEEIHNLQQNNEAILKENEECRLQMTDAESQITELEEQVKMLHHERQDVEETLQQRVNDHKKAIQEYEARISKLRSQQQNIGKEEGEQQEDMIRDLRTQLEEESLKHLGELEKLRLELASDPAGAANTVLGSKIQALQQHIQSMQDDYEHELLVMRSAHRREMARTKDELMRMVAAAEAKSTHVDEDAVRKKYMKEIERIKEIYDRGFANMEKSHQKVLQEMRRQQKRELDLVRQEKEQLLKEETKATQAALDAMKKAHEAELQKERNKFLEALSKTYNQADMDTQQQQHEEDLEMIQNEIKQLSEQYSLKCLENASLEEHLEKQTAALQESRKRVHDLMARNEELNSTLRQDIQKLNRAVARDIGGSSPFKRENEPQASQDLRVALKVKDAEIRQMNEEIGSLKQQLESTTEELEDTMEKYTDLYSEHQLIRDRFEKELFDLKRQMDGEEEEERRRRSAGFGNHIRSCSQDSTGSHESRDSVGSHESGESPSDRPHSTDNSNFNSTQPDRSPSPKRSRSTEPLVQTAAKEAPVERATQRMLPALPTGSAATPKKTMRQRKTRRAMSNPGLVPIQMTVEQHIADPDHPNSPASSPQVRRRTTVGISVAERLKKFQE